MNTWNWTTSHRKATLPADWKRRRAIVLARDRWTCQLRGPRCIGHATDVDHRVSHANGGSDELVNLWAACQPCHLEKTARERPASRGLGRHPGEPHPGAIRPGAGLATETKGGQ